MNKRDKILFIISAVCVVIATAVLIITAINWNNAEQNTSAPTKEADKEYSSTTRMDTESAGQETSAGDMTQTDEQPTTSEGNNLPIPIIVGNHTVVGSQKGSGREGIEGTGDYNYGEALQKSLIFYELQRSGALPETVRCNWRGDSCLNDGNDNGVDLSGGWYDAGDNVKFNLPMSYSAAMLGWSIYEDRDAYEKSNQLKYALNNIRWANDYFIKCHPSDEVYYYQVGSGNQDHTFWGSAEVVDLRMSRPSYKVTASAPGSAVCGETAASLAICSIIFADIDSEYSKLCLSHAKSLYEFADRYKSDAGYTEANGFYNSWSGFYDELAWAGAWLYLATNDKAYLTKAETYYPKAGQDFDWAMCWDDVHIGAAILLARITGKDIYINAVEKHLDFWTVGTSDGKRITYSPKGLAWLDSWGSLRYATTTGFLAMIYAESESCSATRKEIYNKFGLSQANYALGSTGFSYQIGYGNDYPLNPHHRTAQGSYCDNMNTPSPGRHILYGALVGGPDANDGYLDTVTNFNTNEVACDYNAGFTGLLAKLYNIYHGKTIVDFGAVEEIDEEEYYVEAGINASGNDFIEIKAFVYNETGWPARAIHNIELRYFIDISEIISAGGDASMVEVTTNYMKDAKADGIKTWDEANNIYYLSVLFDGDKLYPGGQEQYKKEVQVRLKSQNGTWDNSNDPSYAGLTSGNVIKGFKLALYADNKLVYGTEPQCGDNPGQSVGTGDSDNTTEDGNNHPTEGVPTAGGEATNGDLAVKIEYSSSGASTSSISGMMNISNNGSTNISLSDLKIYYYFTNDGGGDLQYACYHAGMNLAEGGYNTISSVTGSFSSENKTDADTVCVMSFADSTIMSAGSVLTVNFCINHNDWSNFNMANDYSAKAVNNIVITQGSNVIFGTRP